MSWYKAADDGGVEAQVAVRRDKPEVGGFLLGVLGFLGFVAVVHQIREDQERRLREEEEQRAQRLLLKRAMQRATIFNDQAGLQSDFGMVVGDFHTGFQNAKRKIQPEEALGGR